MRFLLPFAALLCCSCGEKAPPVSGQSEPGGQAGVKVMETARAFVEAVNKEQKPDAKFPGELEKFIDTVEFERRIFHRLKAARLSGALDGEELQKVFHHPESEDAQSVLHETIWSGSFPIPGSSVAVVGLSPAGRPVLRWENGFRLNYGELEISTNEPEKGVRFVDLHLWADHCQASMLTRARLMQFASYRGIGTWESPLDGYVEYKLNSRLLLPPSLFDFGSFRFIPASRDDVPVDFAGLELVMLNIAEKAQFLRKPGGEQQEQLAYGLRVLAAWKQKFPDSPALLLRSHFSDGDRPTAVNAMECRRLLKQRGVSDPILDYRIARLHIEAGEFKEAGTFLAGALREHPGSGLLRWSHFRNLVKNRDFDEAAAYWPEVHAVVPWMQARYLPPLDGMQDFSESTAGKALLPAGDSVREFGNSLPDALFAPADSNRPPTALVDESFAAVLSSGESYLFDSEGGFQKPDRLETHATALRRYINLLLPSSGLSKAPSPIVSYRGLILVKAMLLDPERYFRVLGEYPTRVTFLLSAQKPWGHVAQPSLPELTYAFLDPSSAKSGDDPTGSRLCFTLGGLSVGAETPDSDYARAREAVVAEFGETPWLRGRDVIRAVTMSRHAEAVKTGTALLDANRLGAEAAVALMIAASTLDDIPLAIRALDARQAYDEIQPRDKLRECLQSYSDTQGWRKFEGSPAGHEWFVNYTKKASGIDLTAEAKPRPPTPELKSREPWMQDSRFSPSRKGWLDNSDEYFRLLIEDTKRQSK